MKASYIICTKNRIEDLKRLFVTIEIQTLLPEEIIIVDSSDNQDTADFINSNEYSFKQRVLYFHTQPGLTLQRNFGIDKSSGEIVFFTDDDGLLEPDYFAEMMKSFQDESVMGVGALETNYIVKSRISSFVRRIFMLSRGDGNGMMQASGFPAYQHMSNKTKIVETEILGGFCGYRKQVFQDFRFDENLNGYALMEDGDFSYRVSKKNKLLYNPYVRVYHNMSQTERINYKKLFFMTIYNHYYLTKKNIGISRKNILPILWAYTGVFLRALLFGVYFGDYQPVAGFFAGINKIITKDIEGGSY